MFRGRRAASAIAAALLAAALLPAPCDAQHNIVVILADDVGVDLVGCYEEFYEGHPAPGYENHTPCIDYLAETGLLFRNAWTNPTCSPTRAQILTGQPACHSGVGIIVDKDPDGRMGVAPFQETVASILRRSTSEKPYISVWLGKWHMASRHDFPVLGKPCHPLGLPDHPWFDLYAGSVANLSPKHGENHNRWTKTFATPIQPGWGETSARPLREASARLP